eukprot:431539_1
MPSSGNTEAPDSNSLMNNRIVWFLCHPIEALIPSNPFSKPNEWIINGKVYDLTSWIPYHPGGSNMLLMNKGRDCTELFMTYHILSDRNIHKMLDKYYIRDAQKHEIDTPYNWNNTQFTNMFNDFQTNLQIYFKQNNFSHGAKATNFRLIFLTILTLLLFYISYFYWLSGYWISNIIIGFLLWLISSNIMHCGTHYAMFNSSFYNELISDIVGFYHCFTDLWIWQHVLTHHAYTNIKNKDIDLYWWYSHHRLHPNDIISSNDKTRYTKWRDMMWFLISMTSIGAMIRAIEIKLTQKGVPENFNKKILERLLIFYSNKRYIVFVIQFICIFILLPFSLIYQFGIIKGLLFAILPRFMHGILYYIFSQVSHGSEKAFRNINVESDNFIIHQILSSVDYCTDSILWNYLSIGLNNQCMHHLAPGVHPMHYIGLEQNVLIPFCKKYDIKRMKYNSFWETLSQHYAHLKKLND